MGESNLFKILLVGEMKTGKTSLLTSQGPQGPERTKQYVPTIGIDFSAQQLMANDKVVKLQMWDSSGDQKYKSLAGTYCKGVHGVIVVYDTTNKESFDKVKDWLLLVQRYCSTHVQYFLVGNKTDVNERQVTHQQGQEFAEGANMRFHEVSAMDVEQVKRLFLAVAVSLLSNQVDEEKIRRRAAMAPTPAKKSSICVVL